MPEIVTERFENILRIQFNRPEKKNAMTLNMYSTVAVLLNAAATDDETRVVLLHGAGDAFSAGNDLGDFLHNPPKSDDSPQARFIAALIDFDKPLIAAVQGVAIGGGTTMLTHFDFVYAAEHTRFQMPFVNLALVPELGTSYWLPAQIGYLAAAELVLLALPFDARRAAELGLVTRVVAEADLMATAVPWALKWRPLPNSSSGSTRRVCSRLMPRKRSRLSWKSASLTSRGPSNPQRPHRYEHTNPVTNVANRICFKPKHHTGE